MGEEFSDRNLSDADIQRVEFDRAKFRRVSFAGARMHEIDLTGARIRGSEIIDLELSGDVDRLVVNGIDVTAYVSDELLRRYPERARLTPTDAAGYRDAWAVIEDLWGCTVTRARAVDPELLQVQVDGEWSFIETLRHLLFATDSWIGRVLLGEPLPWHPLDLPWDGLPDTPGVPRDRAARPSLDEVLALRADRMARVRSTLADLTDERLAQESEPVEAPGWPPSRSYPIREVYDLVINEEWWHRRFAERDLDALVGRTEVTED